MWLDGGPFSPNTSLPYDPQQGWAAERAALLAAAAGLGGTPSDPGALLLYGAGSDASADAAAAAAGDLSDSLQRLWLLVEATAELQGSKELLSGSYRGLGLSTIGRGNIDRLNASLLALFKVSLSLFWAWESVNALDCLGVHCRLSPALACSR